MTANLPTPTAVLLLDEAGRYVDANAPALDLLGVASVELLRATSPDTFSVVRADPEEEAAFRQAYADSAARGLLIEGAFRRADGELIRARTAILRDEEGGYRALLHPIERPTKDLSWRVYTVADVLAEWRGAERRLVELDETSDEAASIHQQIELLREQYQRMFTRSSARSAGRAQGLTSAPALSTRALNRTLLARQLLLERSTRSPADALEYLVGLQAQNPPSPYQALHARLAAFDPAVLSDLLERHEAVRMVLIRGTIHLVTARDAAALRPVVQPVLDRELFGTRTWGPGVRGVDLAPVLAYGRELVEDEPRTMQELRDAIAERWPDLDAGTLAYAIRNQLPTLQATPRGLWGRSGAVRLTTLQAWTGLEPAAEADPSAAILRYLRAFGPASVADAAAWSRLTGLREPFEQLRPQLRTFRDERGRELFDVPDAPILTGDEPAPVRLLPDYDNATLSHADRSRILPVLPWPELGDNVTAPVYLVDGFVAGIWKPAGKGPAMAIELRPLTDLAPVDRTAVEAEASAMLALIEPAADPGARRWLDRA